MVGAYDMGVTGAFNIPNDATSDFYADAHGDSQGYE